MEEVILRYLEVFGIIIAVLGAVFFGWKQYQINKRMQELADYIAVAIVPMSNFSLQIKNVGRSNLYLHKWEVGFLSETYIKPWLLPASEGTQILIMIQPQQQQIGQHIAKFYFTDEKNIKYLSMGEVVIEPVAFQLPSSTTPPQPQQQDMSQTQVAGVYPTIMNIQLRMRAWAYKTEKYNWTM